MSEKVSMFDALRAMVRAKEGGDIAQYNSIGSNICESLDEIERDLSRAVVVTLPDRPSVIRRKQRAKRQRC